MITMQVVGTLGKDAEVKDLQGKKVINFYVAVNQGYGDNKTTLWVDCAKWGEKTGISEYLKKGTKVAVHGEPSIRKWDNGATITLRVADIELLGGKNENQQQDDPPKQEPASTEAELNDLPF